MGLWRRWTQRNAVYTAMLAGCPSPACVLHSSGGVKHTNAPFKNRFNTVDTLDGLCVALAAPSEVAYRLNNALLQKEERQESVGIHTLRLVPLPSAGAMLSIDSRLVEHKTSKVSVLPDNVSDAQLAQIQKMQAVGQLAGGIAHDFNNLLTAIIGFCDLLLLRHVAHDPSYVDIKQVRDNASRGAHLVKQLLAFARQQTLQPRPIVLNTLLRDAQPLLQTSLTERVKLELRLAADLPHVLLDAAQFESVVLNLAVNARDAMPQGGSLTIATQLLSPHEVQALNNAVLPTDSYVRVRVTDTGEGMPPQVADKIFEPFFTTKEAGKGTGLGLSMVYGVVKQSGGYIFVDSTQGHGTTFDIYLPPCEAPTAEAEAPPPATDLSGSLTILLVEDEPAVRAFAVRALQSRGHTVFDTDDAEEALAILQDQTIDLMISDVVMPDTDGPTLVAAARQTHPHLKVIFMSGYAEEAFRKNLHGERNFTFLPKPFSLRQLTETVKAVASRE